MKHCKRSMMVILSTVLLASMSVPCSAAENAFRDIFENAFYGGLAGTLVGGALLVFTHKPADHLDYLSYGAAGGVLAGAAYGVAKSAKSLVAIEDGTVKFAMPTIMPELRETNLKGGASLMLKAELIRGNF